MENRGSLWGQLLYWEDLLICWQFLKESDGSLLICLIWNQSMRSWKIYLKQQHYVAGKGWAAFINLVHFSSWLFFSPVRSLSLLHSFAKPRSEPTNPLLWKTLSRIREEGADWWLRCMSGDNCSASPRNLLSQSEGFSSQVALCRPGFLASSLPGSCVHAMSLQSCLTLCDLMDCSPPGSPVHGMLQARKLERVAMPSSGESSWPKDRTWVLSFKFPALQGGFFTTSATWLSPKDANS